MRGPGSGARRSTCQQGPCAARAPPHRPGEDAELRPRSPQAAEVTPALRSARPRPCRPIPAVLPGPRPGPRPGDPPAARLAQESSGLGMTHNARAGRGPWRCRGCRRRAPRGPGSGRFRGGTRPPEVRGRAGPWRRSASSTCCSGWRPGGQPGPRARSSGPASRRLTSCRGRRPADGERASALSAGSLGARGCGALGAGLMDWWARGRERRTRARVALADATSGPQEGPAVGQR